MIKIEEDVGDSSDVSVKIIIKHESRDAQLNLGHNKEGAREETAYPIGYTPMETSSIYSGINGHHNLDNRTRKSLLPDNLFESDLESEKSSGSSQKPTEFIPEFKSRSGIEVGSCPQGFIRRGMLCLPNNS